MEDFKITNSMVVPFKFYAKILSDKMTVYADKFCHDEKMYLLDKDGRVHCFTYDGVIARDEVVNEG